MVRSSRFFAAFVATSLAAAAHAQAAPMVPAAAFSKSAAILGGASHLSQILAEQGALPARAAAAPTVVQPASWARPTVEYAVAPKLSKAVWDGRPDVFGSVALSVGRTPLDSRWRHVEGERVSGAAAAFARSLRGLDPVERARRVNAYVNRRVTFTDDYRQYGRADVWSSANQTLRRGRGDCEDYAIAKLQMLREAGLSPRDLYLVLVKDLVRRADHAVLVVRAGGEMLLLDNGTDRVLDSATVADYRPMLTFASYGEWTHGYVMQSAPPQIARSDLTRPIQPAADQRSVSASLLAFNTGFSR